MNIIVDNFPKILEFAATYGIPTNKKRGILREYLQVKILEKIYQKKLSSEIFFIGGTSLRILRGLDRFSEDLDFDLGKINQKEIKKIINEVVKEFANENIEAEIYQNQTAKRNYFEIRFPNLLYQLNISNNKDEKLTIKLDFEKYWKSEKREIILVNRYGFIFNAVTINIDQILTQKLFAYISRKQTLGRDIYDVIWLIGQGANIDWNFAKKNSLPQNLQEIATQKFEKEKKSLANIKRRLIPFLIEEENADKLIFFPKLVSDLK